MSRTKKDKNLGSIMGFSFIAFEIHLREQYLNHMESHFEKELEVIGKDYEVFMWSIKDKEDSDMSEEALSHYKDSFIDDVFLIQKVYRKNFRESQIIQLYSFLEDLLMKGCNMYASIKKTSYKVTDLNGQNDIDRIKKYLNKTVGINIGDLNPEWIFIDNLRVVRNQVVHHNGIIKNNDIAKSTDKKFNKVKAFSVDNFSLETYLSSSARFQIVFDKPKFMQTILKNIESLITKIAVYEVD